MENDRKTEIIIIEKKTPLPLSIVIPVRNDGLNLKMMLKVLSATVETPCEFLIVSDTINDDSCAIVRNLQSNDPRLRFVLNTFGVGVGQAILTGINESRGKYILILTADDLGPVLAIEAMCGFMDQGYDLVCPTRYALGGRYWGGPWLSRLFSRLANTLFFWIVETPLTDLTLGIKMFQSSIVKKINLESTAGWSFALELSIKAQLNNLKIAQIPIISINRFYGGKSNFKLIPWGGAYSRLFFWGIKEFYRAGRLRFQTIFKR